MSDPRAFHASRPLRHPPERVFEAFADPVQLARWWGPDGFSNEFDRFEFKPGGLWVFTMIGPNGARYANTNRFESINRPSGLVIRHDCAPFFTLAVRIEAAPGGSRITWDALFDDAAVAQAVRHIVEPANQQNFDRLERVLADSPNAA